MFTGLVDATGTIVSVRSTDAGREVTIESPYGDLAPGESVAVNGACLTVREAGNGNFTVAAVSSTLPRTTIGEWASGRRVNLERALRADSRLGGHIVQGHVDAVGEITAREESGDALLLNVALPPAVAELVVPLGSITIDGVSLTVNDLPSPGTAQLSIVEFTRAHTTLGDLRPGDRVHVEADVIAKYVQRMVAPYRSGAEIP
ncbi:MAG: riboflavin synthase [Gemmatimonadaceae bacterium]|nr:riboflavin synthase [Gemmatimonadaceae bacterium]